MTPVGFGGRSHAAARRRQRGSRNGEKTGKELPKSGWVGVQICYVLQVGDGLRGGWRLSAADQVCVLRRTAPSSAAGTIARLVIPESSNQPKSEVFFMMRANSSSFTSPSPSRSASAGGHAGGGK